MALHGGGHLELKKMHKGDFWGLFGIRLGRCPCIIPKKISSLQFYSRFNLNALALCLYLPLLLQQLTPESAIAGVFFVFLGLIPDFYFTLLHGMLIIMMEIWQVLLYKGLQTEQCVTWPISFDSYTPTNGAFCHMSPIGRQPRVGCTSHARGSPGQRVCPALSVRGRRSPHAGCSPSARATGCDFLNKS